MRTRSLEITAGGWCLTDRLANARRIEPVHGLVAGHAGFSISRWSGVATTPPSMPRSIKTVPVSTAS